LVFLHKVLYDHYRTPLRARNSLNVLVKKDFIFFQISFVVRFVALSRATMPRFAPNDESELIWMFESCQGLMALGRGFAVGIMALLAAAAEGSGCDDELTASLQSLGVTYILVGVFGLCMAVVWSKNKDDTVASEKQGACPLRWSSCANLAAFINLIVCSVGDNSDECKDSPRLGTMILVYVLLGVHLLCAGCGRRINSRSKDPFERGSIG
jgi:hypothetical protein